MENMKLEGEPLLERQAGEPGEVPKYRRTDDYTPQRLPVESGLFRNTDRVKFKKKRGGIACGLTTSELRKKDGVIYREMGIMRCKSNTMKY